MAERRRIGWPEQNCLPTLGGLPIYTTLASKYMQLWPPNIYNLTRLISGLHISKPTLPPCFGCLQRNEQGNQTNSEINFKCSLH